MGYIIRDSNPSRGNRLFSIPKCPDWLWGLIQRGKGFFLGGEAASA